MAILLTSHDLADVERLADRIHILVGGRVVAAGTPAELAAGLRPRLRLRLDRPLTVDELASLRVAAGGSDVTVDGDRYLLDALTPSPAAIAAIATWAAAEQRLIVELRSVGGSLEDAYLDLVGAGVSRPASWPQATLAQVGMEGRLTARRGENVLALIGIPAAVLLFFGSVDLVPARPARPDRHAPTRARSRSRSSRQGL